MCEGKRRFPAEWLMILLRRVPDRAARVLLTVVDRDPEAVVRALEG